MSKKYGWLSGDQDNYSRFLYTPYKQRKVESELHITKSLTYSIGYISVHIGINSLFKRAAWFSLLWHSSDTLIVEGREIKGFESSRKGLSVEIQN